jgi:predicted aspartyl protease
LAKRTARLFLERAMLTKRTFLELGAAAIVCRPAWAMGAGSYPLIVRNDRLYLDIAINEHRVRALLDSAAESTLLDAQFANSIGLHVAAPTTIKGSGGDEDAAFADSVTVKTTGLILRSLRVGVLDLSDVGKRLVGGPLPVILGREYFDAARLEIDIAGGRIRPVVQTGNPAGSRLPLTGMRGIETLPVSVEGHAPTAAAFDLGNGGAVLVSAQYARQLGLLTDGRTVARKSGGGIGGEIQRMRLKLKSLEIAGHVFQDVDAEVDETDSATPLNIGVSVLRQFVITTDYHSHTIWLDSAQPVKEHN